MPAEGAALHMPAGAGEATFWQLIPRMKKTFGAPFQGALPSE